MAGNDLLLLDHGAQVTAGAISSAIRLRQVEVLELLLSKGDLANTRQPYLRRRTRTPDNLGWENVICYEPYPLLRAAKCQRNPSGNEPADFESVMMRIMTTLLNHGANPYSTLVRYFSEDDTEFYNDLDESELETAEESDQNLVTKSFTVLHHILSKGYRVQPFF